ncbi:hypothetical protein OIV83_004894 [Microbotryomycetes sp. JL201]|nr:hypothetical protein OIV83_004894 [Microbotryomycetes sp. JL201]
MIWPTGGVLDGTSSPLLSSIKTTQGYLATTTPSTYIPFSFFSILHAVRIACAYRGAARAGGYDHKLGNFQAALVPVILILGGTTITNVLMGIVPGWLISPIPVLTYAYGVFFFDVIPRSSSVLTCTLPSILPLLATKLGAVTFLLSLPKYPREIFFGMVDGFTRIMGITTLGIDTVLSHPNVALRHSPWAMIAVATLAGGGGGMIVPAFKGFGPEWSLASTPGWVKDGPGIDIWGATVAGYVYATLIDAHPFFRVLPNAIFTRLPILNLLVKLPKGYLTNKAPTPLLPADEAKIFCALLLGGMLAIRAARPLLAELSKPAPKRKAIQAKSSSPAAVNAAESSSKKVTKEKKTQ